jgi:hypothetical protein
MARNVVAIHFFLRICHMHRWTLLSVVVLSVVGFIGCGGCGPTTPPKKNGGSGHEHPHSHDQAGPHSGKMIAVGAEEFHAEFVMDDASGKVTVYLLDKDMKTNPAAVSSQETITIETKTKDETKTYELAAVGRSAEKTSVDQFEVADKELVGLLKTIGGDNSAILKVTIGEKPFSQNINFEEHGHDH